MADVRTVEKGAKMPSIMAVQKGNYEIAISIDPPYRSHYIDKAPG